ncbi:MAG: hypothetical protein RL264_2755 [Bacteroidota bacterium]|jgi:hypothetical protein
MYNLNPQFITDKTGKKISAVLPMKDFRAILKELEELEDIRLYDESKNDNEPSIPIEDAFKMIEAKRKAK